MTDEVTDPAGPIDPGEAVFDTDGEKLGYVSGLTEDGFEVTLVEADASREDPSSATGGADDAIPGQEFGEGYLMWRCGECGEMGELDGGIPESCPNCGAPEELIRKAEED